MKLKVMLKHEFVEFIPERLAERTIYISIAYATVAHKCCCGCGHEVVTPLSPTDWKLVFDGETVSLDPSIGNWSFPCQSHYWIKRNAVQWAARWTRDEIEAGKADDITRKEAHFGGAQAPLSSPPAPSTVAKIPSRASGWHNLFGWFRGP